jgi:hypothetical protein
MLQKLKFIIDDYDSTYVMHCQTRNESDLFAEYLHKLGRRWASRDSYVGWKPAYPWDRGGMCYQFTEGMYGSFDFYSKESNITILEYSDFEWDDEVDLNDELDCSVIDLSFEQLMEY